MKNYDIQAMKQFVYSSVFTTTIVETIVIIQIAACFLAYIFTYNQPLIVALLSPLALCSVAVYILALKTKADDVKRIHLLIGIAGIIATITCIISSVLIIPMEKSTLIKCLIALCLVNIMMMFFCFLHAHGVVKVKTKKYYMRGTVVFLACSSGLVLGKNIFYAKRGDIPFAIALLFIGFSIFFSVTFVFIMRYYYAKILEKIEKEERSA